MNARPDAPLRLLADTLRRRARGPPSRIARRRLMRPLRVQSSARADVADR